MQIMNQLLRNKTLYDILNENGHHVKIEIPFGYTINVKINLSSFVFINKKSDEIKQILPENWNLSWRNLFKLEKDLIKTLRKEGMKTMKNKKKRLAFANLIEINLYSEQTDNYIFNLSKYIIIFWDI